MSIAKVAAAVLVSGVLLASATVGHAKGREGRTDNTPDWFYPAWAATARFNKPVTVLDTDSALGRYSLKTKEIGLKDMARMHGHLCDGLVMGFIELKAALSRLFPSGVVDRTDLRVVSRNSPCLVDAAAFMTGARINFQTLRIDDSEEGYIVQRISTGEAYEVHLEAGMFPKAQEVLEGKIRGLRAAGQPVSAADIDEVEHMANDLSRRLLNMPPSEVVQVTKQKNYVFTPNYFFGHRGDVIDKDMPREK